MKRGNHCHSLSLALEERKPKEIKTLSPDTSRKNINVLEETQTNLNYLMTNVKTKYSLHKNHYKPISRESVSPLQKHYLTAKKTVIHSQYNKSVFMSNLTTRLAELEGKLNVYQEKANCLKLSFKKSKYSPTFNKKTEVSNQNPSNKQTFLIPTINIHNHNYTELCQSKKIRVNTANNCLDKCNIIDDNDNPHSKENSRSPAYTKNELINDKKDEWKNEIKQKNHNLCLLGQCYNIKMLKESIRETKEDVIQMKKIFKEVLIETQEKIVKQIQKEQKAYFNKVNDITASLEKTKEQYISELATADKTSDLLHEELLSLRRDLSGVEEQKMKSFKEIIELKAENLMIKEEISNCTLANKLTIQDLETQLNRKEEKINELLQKKENIIEDNIKIIALTNELEQKGITLLNAKSDNEALLQKIKEKDNQLSERINNNLTLTNAIKVNELKYKKEIEEQIQELMILKQKYNTLSEENHQMQLRFTNIEQIKTKENDNKETRQKEINQLKDIIKTTKIEYDEQTNEVVLLNEEMLIVKNELIKEKDLSKMIINDLHKDYDQYIIETNKQIEKLKHDHAKEKDNLTNQWNDEKDDLLIDITKLKSVIEHMKQQVNNEKTNNKVLSEKLEKAKTEDVSLKISCQEKLTNEQILFKEKKKEYLEYQIKSESLLKETKELNQSYINKLKNEYEGQLLLQSNQIKALEKFLIDSKEQNNILQSCLNSETYNHNLSLKEIDSLTLKIKQLSNENELINNNYNQSNIKITKLTDENQKLNLDRNEYETNLSILKKENSLNIDIIQELKDNIQQLKKENERAYIEKEINTNKNLEDNNILVNKVESHKGNIIQLEQLNSKLTEELHILNQKTIILESDLKIKNEALQMLSLEKETYNAISLHGEDERNIIFEVVEVVSKQGERGSILKEKGFYKKAINKTN